MVRRFGRRAALARSRRPSAEPPRGWGLLRTADFWGLAGRVGSGGDAVNPSMGAWPRHPCRGHPRPAYPPGPGQVPARPATKDRRKKTKAKAGRCALQCLISDISWVPASGRHYRGAFTHGRRSRKSVGGGVVGASRTVGAMDGAIEPPWMGLRRVLLASTAPPAHRKPALAVALAVAVASALASAGAGRRPAKAIPLLPVQCRARFPTTVPRT